MAITWIGHHIASFTVNNAAVVFPFPALTTHQYVAGQAYIIVEQRVHGALPTLSIENLVTAEPNRYIDLGGGRRIIGIEHVGPGPHQLRFHYIDSNDQWVERHCHHYYTMTNPHYQQALQNGLSQIIQLSSVQVDDEQIPI